MATFGRFTERTTVLLDDSPYKAAHNPQHTSLHPPEWTPLEEDRERDGALACGGLIRSALAACAAATDDVREAVRSVNERNSARFWARPSEDHLYRRLRRRTDLRQPEDLDS